MSADGRGRALASRNRSAASGCNSAHFRQPPPPCWAIEYEIQEKTEEKLGVEFSLEPGRRAFYTAAIGGEENVARRRKRDNSRRNGTEGRWRCESVVNVAAARLMTHNVEKREMFLFQCGSERFNFGQVVDVHSIEPQWSGLPPPSMFSHQRHLISLQQTIHSVTLGGSDQ